MVLLYGWFTKRICTQPISRNMSHILGLVIGCGSNLEAIKNALKLNQRMQSFLFTVVFSNAGDSATFIPRLSGSSGGVV